VRIFAIGPRGGEIPFSFGEVVPAPWADAGGPYLVPEGDRLILDGARSVGADSYWWDLDGDLDFDDASGPAPQLDASGLDGPGDFYVYLRVTGPGGEPDEDDALVEVSNQPPEIVRFDVPAPVVAGVPARFLIEAVDPCPAPADQLSWSFDLGGGELLQARADGIEARFDLPGTYHIRAEVVDDDGGAASIEPDVLVVPAGESNGGCGCSPTEGLQLWLVCLVPVVLRKVKASS
jgi:hypothetical protein